MIKDIVVLDDWLPESYVNLIEKEMSGNTIKWHFMEDVTYDQELLEEFGLQDQKKPAFSHKFFDYDQGGVISPGYGLVTPIAHFACDKIGYKPTEIFLARSFLTIPVPGVENLRDHPHVDTDQPCLNVLYYVSDADGDTVFFEEMRMDALQGELDRTNMHVRQTVSPKKGRAVLFDGQIYHTSTRPKHGTRIVINFGLI